MNISDVIIERNKFATVETVAKETYFICPKCNTIYRASIASTIFYDRTIDIANQGVFLVPSYSCHKCNEWAFEVDKDIVKLVQKIRRAGIKTITSCSGHAKGTKFDGGQNPCCLYQDPTNDNENTKYNPAAMIGIYADYHSDIQEVMDSTFSTAFIQKVTRRKVNSFDELCPNVRKEYIDDKDGHGGRYFVYSFIFDDDYMKWSDSRKDIEFEKRRKELEYFFRLVIAALESRNRSNAIKGRRKKNGTN